MTYDQVAARKDKAERFVRDVLQDSDHADAIASEDVQSYADRKHLKITNPRRESTMANGSQTKQDLLDEISDLQDENDALQAQLDAIQDVLAGPDDDGMDDDGTYDDDDAA
jgi:hypothetical protein